MLTTFFAVVNKPLQKLNENYDCILDSSHQQGHSRNNASVIIIFCITSFIVLQSSIAGLTINFFFAYSQKHLLQPIKLVRAISPTKLFLTVFDIKRIEIPISLKFKSIIFSKLKMQIVLVFFFKILNKLFTGLKQWNKYSYLAFFLI